MSEGTKILQLLQNIRASVKSAAIDAPTSHPSGSAPDGDTTASEGAQSAANEASVKENLGGTAADASANANPKKLETPPDNQKELEPGSVDKAPPAEIKPKETKPAEEPGSINEKIAKVQSDLANYLAEVSAIIPVVKNAEEGSKEHEKKESSEEESKEKKSGDDESKEKESKDSEEKKAAALNEIEKMASDTLKAMLASQKVAPDASEDVKRAALVKAAMANAEAAFAGFALTFDNAVMTKMARGDYSFIKTAGDEVLPDDTGGAAQTTAPAAGAGDAPADAAAAPEAGAAGGAAPSEDELIQEILKMVDSGQLPPDQLVAALQAVGVSEQKIQEVVQALGQAGGAAGGAPADAGAGAAAPAEAGPSAPPEAAVESAKTASAKLVRQALNQILA